MSRILKQRLLAAYGNFSDKRIKNVDKGSIFILDNRSEGERLNMAFCQVFLNVTGENEFKLIFSGNLPYDKQVQKRFDECGGVLAPPCRRVRQPAAPHQLVCALTLRSIK